ncbi:eukaryotic aspartyl protease family protein [Actinidia rufa]|uniref:Eukaryotic aspartyl protease family protein n=1 Tax=Actinidia rufa TaxID=165716 RepID=A0A7J0DQE7_9ERIC|nr:eukaryotic aspartyl protease family protein [Actinidia rufa]
MDSFQSLTSLLLLLLTTSLLVQPSFSTPHQSLNTKLGFRVGATRIDYGKNLTKLQLVQRSLHHGRARLEMFTKMATTASGNNIQAPIFPGSGDACHAPSVFDQPTPVFDTTKSSTCSNVSCTSDLCQDMNVFKCTDGCKYLYSYGDESSTEGFMAQDTFTFEDSGSGPVSIPNIGFGCGVNNQGTGFGQGSGLVGLGRGPLSLVSQLGLGKFSYCLTSISENKTSNVLFGALADLNYSTSGASHRTPLVQNPFQPSFYYVSLEGITIGETLLPMPKSTMKLKEDGSGGMIIDSGTTLTYLQEEAFRALKMEFKSQMKLRVSESSDTIGLDLCFDLPTEDLSEIAVPKLKLHFEGMDLELPPENYMISDPSMGVVCLAMAASSRMSILGNIQQQNLLVLHDLEKETVSFIPTQCDQL